jgi:hypothetical protein
MVLGAGKMVFRASHDIHKKRFSRNVGLGLVLAAFVALMFALTVAKVTSGGDPMHMNDGKPAPQTEAGT